MRSVFFCVKENFSVAEGIR